MNNNLPIQQLDGCINTKSGAKLNLLDPDPKDICIEDIARGLSQNSHFGGQTPHFFSIAQHCILVCQLMEESFNPRHPLALKPQLLLAALLHDASEAYLGDMVKPLKVHLPEFQKIENKLQEVIFNKWHLPIGWIKDFIKIHDIEAQDMEFNQFYRKVFTISYLSPEESYDEFFKLYRKYTMEISLTPEGGTEINSQ